MIVPVKKLSDVAEINPRRPSIERKDETTTSFIPMTNVCDENGVVSQVDSVPYSKVKKGYTYFQNDDVIFAKITPCMQNGKHAIVRELIDGFGFGSTEFHVIRPTEEVLPEWIHYFLRRKETLDAGVKTFTGAVGQQRVPVSFLESLMIPVPDIEVQRKITSQVNIQLSEARKARKAAEEQYSEAKIIRTRILEHFFAELDSTPKYKIGDKAHTTSGSTPARGNKSYWTSGEKMCIRDRHYPVSRVVSFLHLRFL